MMLNQAFHAINDYFGTAISRKVCDYNGHAKAYITGVESPFLNMLVVEDVKGFEYVINDVKKENIPFVIEVPKDILTDEFQNLLHRCNFTLSEITVVMYMDLSTYTIMPTQDTIKNVNDALHDWVLPLTEAYESTPAISDQYKTVHQRAQDNLQHFSLYIGNTPVASLTLSIHDGNAKIDDVGTLPTYQRKGYATQLIHHALNEAKQCGAQYCFLGASQKGLPVYEKMGFKALFESYIFIPNKA